jgi:hypothetical protein
MASQRVWLEALRTLAQAEACVQRDAGATESSHSLVDDRAFGRLLRACTLLVACSTTESRTPKAAGHLDARSLSSLHNSGTLGFQLVFVRARIRMLDAWVSAHRLLTELVSAAALRERGAGSMLSADAVARRVEGGFVELRRVLEVLVEVGTLWTQLGLATLDIEACDVRLLHHLSICCTLLPQLLARLLPDGALTDARTETTVQALARDFSRCPTTALSSLGKSLTALNTLLQVCVDTFHVYPLSDRMKPSAVVVVVVVVSAVCCCCCSLSLSPLLFFCSLVLLTYRSFWNSFGFFFFFFVALFLCLSSKEE